MGFLHTLLAFILALGILIVVHELGHFTVARLFNVKVLRFSVGFGRPLFTRRLGPDQTEWSISAFPLGGYVKMLDEDEGDVPPEEASRAFNRQPPLARMAIVAAGPAANFLLAIILYWSMNLYGVPGIKAVLDAPQAGTPAAEAGLRRGEMVVAIGGDPIASWQDVRWALMQRAGDGGTVELETRDANGAVLHRTLPLERLTSQDLEGNFLPKLGLALFQPDVPPVVGTVLSEGAGARGGLLAGDFIMTVDGRPVTLWQEVVEAVRNHPARPMALRVKRGGEERELTLTPDAVTGEGRTIGRLGVSPRLDESMFRDLMVEVSYPVHIAFVRALAKTWEMSVFSLKMMARMVGGEVSWKNLSGPLTIADYAGQAASLGWMPYVGFLALISVSLGVLNLLPVPLLDGGHLVYYMAELIRGRPLPPWAMETGQRVGIALLTFLTIFALYNDINRLLAN